MRVSAIGRKGAAKHVLILLGIILLCPLMCCGGFLTFGWWLSSSEKKQIAEGHQLWEADSKGEAVAKYKSVLKGRLVSDKAEKAKLFQRVIEFETERGEIGEAREFIDLALKSNVPLTLTKPDAQELLARVRSQGSAVSDRNPEQEKLELKLKVLDRKIATVEEDLAGLRAKKREIIENLKRTGVNSAADLKGNAEGQKYANRLQEVVQELEVMQRKHKDLVESADQGKWVLDRLERQIKLKQAGISEDELAEASVMIAKIDDKLKGSTDSAVPSPLKLEAVLEKELKGEK